MDDSAIKSPSSVTLVHVESNAVHEKQLSLGGRSVDLCEGNIGGG
jgi:hypothetical protein